MSAVESTAHPTHSRLHDGVEATLGHIDVGGHALLGDDLVELLRAAGQRQHVLVAKRWQAALFHAPGKHRRRAFSIMS